MLFGDAIDAATMVLSQYVSNTTFADAFRSISGHYRWRKVSEELPESDQVVLVKMDFGKGYFYDIGRYDCNDKMFYSEAFVSDSMWNSLDDVIEWKPID